MLYPLTIVGATDTTEDGAKIESLPETGMAEALGADLTAVVGPVEETLGAVVVVLTEDSGTGALTLVADEIPGPDVVLVAPAVEVLIPRIKLVDYL